MKEVLYDVVTFGEAMIRLSPPGFQRLEQTRSLEMNVAGSELNVAVGVTRFGLRSAWVSKLPRNPLGFAIRNRAQELAVDCSHIVWSEEGRAGIYFIDFGAAPRPTEVLYDRSGSAISRIRPDEVPWRSLFERARHFHVSGITPALSPSAAAATAKALETAKESGCSVSYDLNYRSKLWRPEDARRVQEPLMDYVDILITNQEDPCLVFGLKEERAEDLAEAMAASYGFKMVVVTLKEALSFWAARWTALAYSGGEVLKDKEYDVEVVDRIGAGDSFAAGFIAGWLETGDARRALQWGNAFAVLKHTFPGDFNWCTREDVETFLEGGGRKVSR